MKKKLFVLVCTVILIPGLVACSSQGNSGKGKKHPTTETTTSTTKKVSKKEQDNPLKDMQQIGNDRVGYVFVPKDWVRFKDLNGSDSYQYSATDAYTIVTMNGYTKQKLEIGAIDDVVVKQVADNYFGMMDKTGKFQGLTGSRATITDYRTKDSYRAYQVYGALKSDGKILCAWIFKTKKSDRVYLISLEGNKKSDAFVKQLAYIETTWSENK